MVDSVAARYVWEWAYYPQYYLPHDDVARARCWSTDGRTEDTPQRVSPGSGWPPPGLEGASHGPTAGRGGASGRLKDTFRFEWEALDHWFEEDERCSSIPATPTAGSTPCARPAWCGSSSTGWCWPSPPRRSWSSRPACRPATTSTGPRSTSSTWSRRHRHRLPYKGTTSGYWSVRVGDAVHPDLAWTYDFPTRQLLPIAGLVAFYNEKVDVIIDGERVERPRTRLAH